MGKITGFKEFDRHTMEREPTTERIKNYKEFEKTLSEDSTRDEGARCMDCGIPFCHGDQGCPVDNLIPEFNDHVYHGRWKEALDNLHSTNNFPEFTGRLCPAPCEGACTLGITNPPVGIKAIERSIIDRGFAEGLVEPQPPANLTGKKVAVIGSGPAGMACSQQLARAGHSVTLYEKNDRIGGLLRYGIPDFKMEKWHIDRRMEQMRLEGVKFKTGVNVGVDVKVKELLNEYDAVVLAGGSEAPRNLPVDGRDLQGVHYAMDFLTRNNKQVAGDEVPDLISAKGKHVIVIGGGDTGTDCIGTSLRHGCASLVNFELFPKPPAERAANNPWPTWPKIYRVDYGHEEAAQRDGEDPRVYGISSTEFIGDNEGKVRGVRTVDVEFKNGKFENIPGSEREWKADLVLLALGFLGPEHDVSDPLDLTYDPRSNYQAEYGVYKTNVDGVFAAGDCRRGQSLVVRAINEGREAAREIDRYLMGATQLP